MMGHDVMREVQKWMCRVLLVVCAGACQPAPLFAAGSESTRRAHDLQIIFDWRWAGGANGGYYPLRIRLTNLAQKRAMRFEFAEMGGRDSRLPTVWRDIVIDQNATQQLTLAIPLVSSATYGQLRVFDNGRELSDLSQHITLPEAQGGGADRPSLLVISPSPASVVCTSFETALESLSAADGASPAVAGMYRVATTGTRSNDFQVIAPQMLPESWIDYTALDIVAIPLASLETIPSEARSALLKWTSAGGTLIVYDVGRPASKSTDLLRLLDLAGRPPRSQAWLPAAPALQKPIAIISTGVAPGGAGMMMSMGGPVSSTGAIPTLVAPGGAATIAPGGAVPGTAPLEAFELANKAIWPVTPEAFSRIDFLAGQVFAFPGNPFPGAPIDWAWWLNSVNSKKLCWTNRNGLSSRQQNSEFFTFLIPGVGAVPVLAFVMLITVFAVIIGPVNYFVVWRRKQLYLLVLTIPAIAFITSAALFGYAMIADGFGVQSRLRSFTLLDQHSRTAVSFNRISLYAGLTPSTGLKFSPETAVYPIWPDHDGFESGSIDWSETQHMARGWLRTQTTAQFETIALRAERSRIDVTAAGPGMIEVANGLAWDIDTLIVKDEAGRLYSARRLPAGATMKLSAASDDDLKALATALAADALQAPPGAAAVSDFTSFNTSRRRAMWGAYPYNGQPQTPLNFGTSLLETHLKLLQNPGQESTNGGGLGRRTYLATISQNPGIELGVEQTRPALGLHVLMGFY